MPMITSTIRSSMSVKPDSSCASRFCSLVMNEDMRVLLARGWNRRAVYRPGDSKSRRPKRVIVWVSDSPAGGGGATCNKRGMRRVARAASDYLLNARIETPRSPDRRQFARSFKKPSSLGVTLPIEAPVELSEPTAAAPLSVDALLEKAVHAGASDLHLTVGVPPALRRRGHIEVMGEFPVLDSDLMRQLIYRITTTEQQKILHLGRQLDFANRIGGLAGFGART